MNFPSILPLAPVYTVVISAAEKLTMTEEEKSKAMEVTGRTATPSSFQTSEGSVGEKVDAADFTGIERTTITTPSQTSAGSLLEQAEAANVAIDGRAATPDSFQTCEVSFERKTEAANIAIDGRAATPDSFQTCEVSFEGKTETVEIIIAEGTGSFQISEGSLVEKALATEDRSYLKGLRLHFLSLRSALLDHRHCFANDPSAWLFCSSLSTSKSQSSGRP